MQWIVAPGMVIDEELVVVDVDDALDAQDREMEFGAVMVMPDAAAPHGPGDPTPGANAQGANAQG